MVILINCQLSRNGRDDNKNKTTFKHARAFEFRAQNSITFSRPKHLNAPAPDMTEEQIMVYTALFASVTSMLISLIQQVRLSRYRVIDIGPLHIERDVVSQHDDTRSSISKSTN